jgi:hypothetical protein
MAMNVSHSTSGIVNSTSTRSARAPTPPKQDENAAEDGQWPADEEP